MSIQLPERVHTAALKSIFDRNPPVDAIDDDGYPSEAALEFLANHPIERNVDIVRVAAFAVTVWHYPDYARIDGDDMELITGGWSGNEEIIAALKSNALWWAMCWTSSNSGGKHTFKINRFVDEQRSPTWTDAAAIVAKLLDSPPPSVPTWAALTQLLREAGMPLDLDARDHALRLCAEHEGLEAQRMLGEVVTDDPA